MDNYELIELAKKARLNAHVPLSNFKVGATVLTKDGKVFTGCNIEDPSGIGALSVCAERCTTYKAISEGYTDFEKIAVVGGLNELIFTTPCGVCRQHLNSFNPNLIIVTLENDEIKEIPLKDLLPYSFNEKFGEEY